MMKSVAGALLAVAIATSGTSVSIRFQGRDRRYLLHAPASAASTVAPLVLVFHGGSDTPENMEEISGFSRFADREGFIVAYPEGIEKNWADGRGSTPPDKMGVDDVGFARAIVDDIARQYSIDRRRIYATGPSNGGIFSLRLACDAADLLAAIGPVIAGLAEAYAPKCHPAAPISVVGISSVADPMVPFDGGEVGEQNKFARGGRVVGSRATQDLLRVANGCRADPQVTPMASRVSDGTTVSRRTYSGCRAGTDVVWYEIDGGGHRWPPHEPTRPMMVRFANRELGPSSKNIDATAVLWEFFRTHPKTP
jgi:polyhydroxybutyrate depolymerase